MDLAPILVSVYNRKQHFVSCIEALAKNRLASESVLYIVSDAAYSIEDTADIQSIREYIDTITGFKEVFPIFRENNYGSHESIYQAISFILKKHGCIIFLEDDILTSVNFLEYMNGSLKAYKDDDRIITITGYAPPFKIPRFYKRDVWVNRRQCAWGFATWKEKWEKIDFNAWDRYSNLISNKKYLKRFLEDGEDLLYILKADSEGELEAGDIRICYYQCIYEKYTVYPVISKTFNTGFDGTGLRCGVSDIYKVELDNGDKIINFPKNISECSYLKIIAKSFYDNKSFFSIIFPLFSRRFKRLVNLLK